jgi:predicted exporter
MDYSGLRLCQICGEIVDRTFLIMMNDGSLLTRRRSVLAMVLIMTSSVLAFDFAETSSVRRAFVDRTSPSDGAALAQTRP